MRPTEAVIDINKLAENAALVKERAGDREIMAIVKADGYGHGAVSIMKALSSLGWNYFGVATVEEALELREEHPDVEIFILGAMSVADMPLCVEKNISFAVHDSVTLKAAKKLPSSAKIHIKVNTGMNRIGFTPAEMDALSEEIASIHPIGIYTHLAKAEEEDKSSALEQISIFKDVLDKLKNKGITFEWIHFGNSGALMEMDLSFSNMVRAGIVLYGYSPGDKYHPELQPIMSIKSRILAVREIDPGEGVSYGYTFVSETPMRIATVPIGYADGYKRQMSGNISAWIDGKQCPQIGRITMDQTIFDITETGADVGDEVELMGEHISCDRLAEAAQTIKAEIIVTLGKRVRRVIKE